MILLPVSEAYAYDYLAILQVKAANGVDTTQEIFLVQKAIKAAGHSQFHAVIESIEYSELLKSNQAVFEAIELAHSDQIAASSVQAINLRRFNSKRMLQDRFWPSEPLLEKKTAVAHEQRIPST